LNKQVVQHTVRSNRFYALTLIIVRTRSADC